MKFTARAGDLRDALDRVTKVVPKTPSQTVYQGVRLRVRDGQLTVTGSTEGEVTLTVTVAITEPGNGDKVLLPKPLTAFLATLTPSTLVTATAGAGPEITVHPAGGSAYKFRLMEATFPNTTAPSARVHDTELAGFAAALRAVKDCAARNKAVQLVSTPTEVRIHATDGMRLSRAVFPGATFGDFSGMLPLGVLELLGEHVITQVALDKRGRIFTASNDQVRVIARLLEEVFPNVDSVLNNQPAETTTIQVRPLTQLLTRLASVSGRGPLVVTLAGDRLRMETSERSDDGSGSEELELEHPVRNEMTFGINLEFFRDAVTSHGEADVELGWTAPRAALFLRSFGAVPVTTALQPIDLAPGQRGA